MAAVPPPLDRPAMATPFVAHLVPTPLAGYDRSRTYDAQDPRHGIPRAFCDAMAVREAVFVGEQGVPLACEHDADDARSCHWVLYASPRPAAAAAAAAVPVGTLRVVPYPHPPHPVPGGRYVDNQLVQAPAAAAEATHQRPPGVDRATTFHTGREPYVKIGRLAVLSGYRGLGLAGQLWRAARVWLEENPRFFDRDVSRLSAEELEARCALDPPHWNGLVCMHAQDRPEVLKTYQKWGFQIDEEMGRWWEEDIPHVGMFIRLNIKQNDPSLAATHVA